MILLVSFLLTLGILRKLPGDFTGCRHVTGILKFPVATLAPPNIRESMMERKLKWQTIVLTDSSKDLLLLKVLPKHTTM